MKRTKGEAVFNVFNVVFLILLSVVCIYPFLYTLTISLSTTEEAMKDGLHLFTASPTLEPYKMAFEGGDIAVAYANTIFRTVVGTALALLVSLMYAYGISRDELPGRKMFSKILIFTMVFNGGTIPTYLVIKGLHLINNRWVYILPVLISAYNVTIARSFFKSIPESLHESALLDGASEFTIFFKIYVPLSKAVIMTLVLWIAVSHWNSWYDSMIYINDNDKVVVQLLLQRMIQSAQVKVVNSAVNENAVTVMPVTIRAATTMIATLPILAVYPFIQKYFMGGVMLGAVKG